MTQNPAFACVGNNIDVECTLTPPNAGDVFTGFIPSFIIGDTNATITANGEGAHNGFDLSRVTATLTPGNSSFVSGFITLASYANSDEDLRMGCVVQYAVNGDINNLALFIRTLRLVEAG